MQKAMALLCAVTVVSAGLPLARAEQAAQAPPPRTNPVIRLLEQGKPAFSIWANYIGVGKDYHGAVTLQNNKNFDFIIYDLEHDPLDVEGLSQFLRALLDPAAIAREGVSATKPVIVRIPPNGREIHQNQWMVKLKARYDQGVRLFFDIGPTFAGGGPSLTAEERKAVGR